jgi:3-oxoacyl-(acyl-carrier-protein) synthase
VSICEDIQGPNGIYTPWEGQGAQALEAGILALESAEARCVLVGGCDVKTHELAFLSLQQQGVFRSWCESGLGVVPGEGAVFLVLEAAESAAARGARAYARLDGFCLRTHRRGTQRNDTWCETLKGLNISSQRFGGLVAAANGDESAEQDERRAMSVLQVTADSAIYPKKQAGDLFAAAAVLQVGLGALLAERCGERVLVNCFGHGSEQAAFVLDQP